MENILQHCAIPNISDDYNQNLFPLENENYITTNYNFILLTLILFFFILLQDYYVTHLSKTARIVNQFKGSPIIPFLGNTFYLFSSELETAKKLSNYFKTYGPCFRMWIFRKPAYVVMDSEVCKKILSSKTLKEKPEIYEKLHDYFIVNGLISSSGEVWQRFRKGLNPAFNYQRFDGFINVFNKSGNMLCTKLFEMFENDKSPKDIHPTVSVAGLEMIFESSLGHDLDIQDKSGIDREYCNIHNLLQYTTTLRIYKPWLYFIKTKFFGLRKMELEALDFLKTKILKAKVKMEQKMRTSSRNKGETKSFIEALLEMNVNDQECYENLMTIVAAGTESTATSVTNTLFYLALNPKHQEKCRQEIDTIIGQDIERDITLWDLAQIKFLEMCWKESLRLKPVPIIARKLSHDLILDNGTTLIKGACVILMIYFVHRNPKVYPDPEKYDPYRFTQEEISKRGTYDYIPFSGGIRNCIGTRYATLEAKVMLIKILKKFKISTEQTEKDFKDVLSGNTRSYPAIKLVLTPRDKINK